MHSLLQFLNYAYFLVVLHILFALVLLEQHVVSAGLLLAFFYSLVLPASTNASLSAQHSRGDEFTLPLVEETPTCEQDRRSARALHEEARAEAAKRLHHSPSPVVLHSRKRLESTSHPFLLPYDDLTPQEELFIVPRGRSDVEDECVVPLAPTHRRSHDREGIRAHSTLPLCRAENTKEAKGGTTKAAQVGDDCPAVAVESSTATTTATTATSGKDGTSIVVSVDDSLSSSALHSFTSFSRSSRRRRFIWVCATALASVVSLCVSIALWLVVSQCSLSNTSETKCSLPSWVYAAPQRTALAMFTGIRVDKEEGIQLRDFFLTVIGLSVVGALSIAQALASALLRCRRTADTAAADVTHTTVLQRMRHLLVRCVVFAPFSALWVAFTGIGEGTIFGTAYVLLSVAVALTYPRCVLLWRRPFWLAYLTVLLFLWIAQACVQLDWIQASFNARVALSASSHRHTFVMFGLLRDADTTAAREWHIAQAVGIWLAGVESVCFHTPEYAQNVAEPRIAHASAAATWWARYREAVRVKEAQQLARALALQRAAEEKVDQLRREREHVSMSRRRSPPPLRGGVGSRTIAGPRGARHPNGRLHAPFGSIGSQCCWLNDKNSFMDSRRAVRGSNGSSTGGDSPRSSSSSVAHGHLRGSTGSLVSRRSFSNSSQGSRPASPQRERSRLSRGGLQCDARDRCWQNRDGRGDFPEDQRDCRLNASESPQRPYAKCRAATASAAAVAARSAEDAKRAVALRNMRGLGSVNELPSYMSQRWAREPTKSPVPSEDDRNENANHFIELLNPSLAVRSSKVTVAAAAAAANGAATTRRIEPPLASALRPFPSVAQREEDVANGFNTPRGFSPFHSVTSVSIEGLSPIVEDTHLFPSTPPPAVDTTAVMLGVESTKDVVAASSSPLLPTDRSNGADGEVEPERDVDSVRANRTRGFLAGLQKKLRTYLVAHTLRIDAGTAQRNGQSAKLEEEAPQQTLLELFLHYAKENCLWVCALLTLVHFTVSATFLSLVPSLAFLVLGLLRRPWPPACFWQGLVVFTAAGVVAKSVLRALFVSGAVSVVSSSTARWLGGALLDVRIRSADLAPSPSLEGTVVVAFGGESWADVVLSVLVLSAAVAQWSLVYADQLVVVVAAAARGGGSRAVGSGRRDSHEETSQNAASPSPLHRFFRRLARWNRQRCGAGADYYTIQLFFDVLALVLFCWAYYVIAPSDTSPAQDNLFYAVQHNRLPGIFVATALGLVVLLFVERVLYVLHARVAKYVLHVLLTVAYHALYLTWRTAGGNDSNGSHHDAPLSVALLMAVKLASLWCSALQLRHGYPLHRTHDPFTVKSDVVHWFGHMAFRTVPFLLELRVLLDWSVSATALKVQHWMLLEDIHHNVYRRYVDMHDLHWTSRHQGRRFPYYVRVYQGMLSFAAILFVLFFPLFWYSTFGPQVHASHVTTWSTEVAFRGLSVLPFYSSDATLRTVPFRDAAGTSIGGNTANAADLLRVAAASDTWQLAQCGQCSSRMWSYTPEALEQVIAELAAEKTAARLVMRTVVARSRATEAVYLTSSFEESYELPASATSSLARALQTWQAEDRSNESESIMSADVLLPSLYTPYAVSSGMAASVMRVAGLTKADCTLTLHRVSRYRGYTCIACGGMSVSAAGSTATPSSSSSARVSDSHLSHAVTYVVASPDVTTVQSSLSLIPNVGIIALYSSFILVISSYIRNIFAGDAHRVVLLQLANPEPVAELLRYLYLTRSVASNGQAEALYLEQLLFLELLDLLRSPRRLMELGGRRADDYADRLYRQDLYEVTKHPFDLRR